MIKPTMFEAFVNTMKKSHIAKQSARKIVAQTDAKAPELEKLAQDILQKSGCNAEVSCRVKSVDSTATKQVRYLDDFDSYANKREEIQNIILGGGMKEIIGDSYGMRFIFNNEKSGGVSTAQRFFDTVLDFAGIGKRMSVQSMENYYGTGIKPYATQEICDSFAKLTYKNPRGLLRHTTATNAEKKFGYTRSNINAGALGQNVEIQGGGKYTTIWGDVEHYLYDVRMGKKPDLSKLNEEQKTIAKEIINEYKKLLANPKLHKEYNDKYLSKIWGAVRNSEIKGLQKAELPELPQGFSDVLNAENIMKLAHV